MTIGGDMLNIMKKSEKAKLTTKRFEGVFNDCKYNKLNKITKIRL